MAEAGIFAEEDRCKLIEGEIIDMAPIVLDHVSSVNRLNQLFATRAAGRAIVPVQNPVRPDAQNEPQPDIALRRYREDFYRHARPASRDVLLIVEVGGASLRYTGTSSCRCTPGTVFPRSGSSISKTAAWRSFASRREITTRKRSSQIVARPWLPPLCQNAART